MKRRAASLEGGAPPELKTGDDLTQRRDWYSLTHYMGQHCDCDRDRGELLPTTQTAELLGISIIGVEALRRRGGPRGFQRKPGRRSWWFCRREDAEDLLTNPEHAR